MNMKIKHLSKIYFVIILGIVLILAFLFFQNMIHQYKPSTETPRATPTPSQKKADMMLSFTQASATADPDGKFSSKLSLNTYGNPVAGVTVNLSYNPAQVKNIKLTPYKDPNSALSNALFNSYSIENEGSIIEVYAIPQDVPEQKGEGDIATLTGTLQSGIQNAQITITSSTAVSRTLTKVILGKVNLEVKR